MRSVPSDCWRCSPGHSAGIISDRFARAKGLDGRIVMLSVCLLLEGVFLIAFSQATTVAVAVTFLLVFGLFTHMACGTL